MKSQTISEVYHATAQWRVMFSIPLSPMCTPLHTTLPTIPLSNSKFSPQLLCQTANLEHSQIQETTTLSHSFVTFLTVHLVTWKPVLGSGLLHKMHSFASTSVSSLCACLRAGFSHVWLVDYNKHMGKIAENAQILKPYVTAWETMPY